MSQKTIPQSKFDYKFREMVTDLIDLAQKEILIATGEFSIYYYPDVRQALRNAWHRGVSIKAYLGRCDTDTIYKVVSDGIVVYRGKKPPEEHFIVVDEKHWIKSEDHEPYAPGTRHGPYDTYDVKTATDKAKDFQSLLKTAKLITKPKRNLNRAKRFLKELYR